MNLLQELTEKYDGNYSEDLKKGSNTPVGKFEYQQKRGRIEVNGTRISVNLNEVSGAMPQAEPARISLHLDKQYEIKLTIFPKGFWKKVLAYFGFGKQDFVPKRMRNQFWFEGSSKLIKELALDKAFADNMLGEQNYIESGTSPTSRIVLTPAYGIRDMEHFEKMILILKRIEKSVEKTNNARS